MSQVHYPCKWYKVKSTSTAIFREKSLPHLWQSGSRQQSIHASPRSLRHLGETEVLPGYCWCTWSIDWEQSPARSLPLHHGQRGCLRGWPRFVHVEDSLRAEGWKKAMFQAMRVSRLRLSDLVDQNPHQGSLWGHWLYPSAAKLRATAPPDFTDSRKLWSTSADACEWKIFKHHLRPTHTVIY